MNFNMETMQYMVRGKENEIGLTSSYEISLYLGRGPSQRSQLARKGVELFSEVLKLHGRAPNLQSKGFIRLVVVEVVVRLCRRRPQRFGSHRFEPTDEGLEVIAFTFRKQVLQAVDSQHRIVSHGPLRQEVAQVVHFQCGIHAEV